MKALLISNLESNTEAVTISDEKYHHLIRVMRSEVLDRVKIFNGRGLEADGEIVSIDKREAVVKIIITTQKPDFRKVSVFAGIPKSDTLDLCIRQLTESGVKSLTLVQTAFSQPFKMKEERFLKIVESAMIQSNNPFFLDFPRVIKFKDFIEVAQNQKVVTLLEPKHASSNTRINMNSCQALFIGPEGGFSTEEAEQLFSSTCPIYLDLPIMRFETALPFALGMIYSR